MLVDKSVFSEPVIFRDEPLKGKGGVMEGVGNF